MAGFDRWISSEFSLFKWIDGYSTYIPAATVSSITWERKDGECPYCGSTMANGVCKGCQNRAGPTELGFADVVFLAPLPDALSCIFDIPEDTMFDALHICGGVRPCYKNGDGGFRFITKGIARRSVPDLMAHTPNDTCMVILVTTIRCKVELLLPEE